MGRLGQYEILAELGRGGMGVVYRGLDPVIRRPVAIKTIRLSEITEPGEREAMQERLEREAQSAGILSHPSIVTVYQFGYQDDIAFLAMEYVDGENLAALMSRERLSRDQITYTLREAAGALDYAHRNGVIHRDIKPANILLAREGRVKIADFGVARLVWSTLTRTGFAVGSPLYMAPEQVQSRNVDGRADQYALAVVAYELLTGDKPFQAETLTGLLFKIVYEEPDLTALRSDSEAARLEPVLRKALAKQPGDRYESCTELAEAFALAVRPEPAAASQPVAAGQAARRRWGAAAWAGAAVVAVGAGGVYLALREPTPKAVEPQRAVSKPVVSRSPEQHAPPKVSPPPAEARTMTKPATQPPAPARKTGQARPALMRPPMASRPRAIEESKAKEVKPPGPQPSPVPTNAVEAPKSTPAAAVAEEPKAAATAGATARTEAAPTPPPEPAITRPALVYQVEPDYTEAALKKGIEGTVVLAFEVDENGRPQNVRVVQPLDPELDQKAIEALRRWGFRPGTRDGKAVRSPATAQIDFRLASKRRGPLTLKKPGKK